MTDASWAARSGFFDRPTNTILDTKAKGRLVDAFGAGKVIQFKNNSIVTFRKCIRGATILA
jgi:hypothetical protein